MSITFIAGELRKALKAASGIVELRNTIPILSCIIIRAKDSEATIEATDLDRLLKWRLPCTGDGEFIVPFAALANIVRHLGSGEMVRIGAAPDNRVRVDMADARASFLSLPIADWPDMGGVPDEGSWLHLTMPPRSLTDLTPFISTEETRYYLNGVYVDVGIDTVITVATNGHTLGKILSAAERENDADCGGYIVPRSAVGWLAKYAREVEALDVRLTPAKARFQGGNFDLTTKLIDGKYPDYHRVVPAADVPTLLEVDADTFVRKLARLDAFGKRYCGLSYDGTRIVGSSSGADGELVSIAFGGKAHKPFDLQFQTNLLSDGVAFIGGQVTIKTADKLSPLRLEGDGSRISVVMPARAGQLKHDLPAEVAA